MTRQKRIAAYLKEIKSGKPSLASYSTGFVLSLIFTIAAYLLVLRHVHSHHLTYSDNFLIFLIIALAQIQLIAQLVFFLHLGREPKPRWNSVAFAFAATVVLILVLGSLWIMNNLSYHHAPAIKQSDQYIIKDEGVQK